MREVHELRREDGLVNGAARPLDDLGREDVADAELLAEPDQQRGHPRGVGLGQLGEVADPHEHLRVRMAPAHLEIAAEARREPHADRLDDRVDEVRLAEPFEVGDRRVEAVEVLGRVRYQHRRRRQALGEVPVRAVQAEHVLHAGLVGHQDLVGIERVDAQLEAGGAQLGDHARPVAEPVAAEREPEVDHVRAGVAVVPGQLQDAVAIQARDVVDLGEHADVALAVARARVGLPEPARERLEVRGALLGRDPEALAQDVDLALAHPRDHDPRDRLRHVEEARDPVGGHQRGHRDLHDRDVVVERELGAAQRVPQRGRRELAGHEQQPLGHAAASSACPC